MMSGTRHTLGHGVARFPPWDVDSSTASRGRRSIFDLKTLKVVGVANAAPDADCDGP